MATSQTNILFDNSSDAAFRAWGSAIGTALTACGLMQTTDTGQINWTTVAHPAAAPAAQGYEIWRFNDTLQATRPVYLKIEYGAAGTGVNASTIWVTAGTGTNGAGTLTGLVSNRNQLNMTVNAVAAYASPLYVSGDLSSINLMTTFSSSAATAWAWQWGFSIERSRNADGTANGDGLSMFLVLNNSTNASACQYFSFTNSLVSTFNNAAFPLPLFPTRMVSHNTGSQVLTFPMVVVTPKVQGPALGWVGCSQNEFPRASTVTVPIAGTNHTYLAITGTSGARALDTVACGLLQRWE